MIIQKNTEIQPLPTEEYIAEYEDSWGVNLPKDYREFLKKYGGGIPTEEKCCFDSEEGEQEIDRFLCLCEDFEDNPLGMYDIDVTWSQIFDRLEEDSDLIGANMIPIAALLAGDYVCLDFRKDEANPEVCVWLHEESDEFSPMTSKVADSFTEFLDMLFEGEPS